MRIGIVIAISLLSANAHAFIPCETSTRYLCSGRCQALASDSPDWAEVQVCGDSPSAAATDAVAELMLQWECAVLDDGAPGPQDDLSCYECSGDQCHPQGGLLPDGSPATSQGGLIAGYECVGRPSYGSEPSHLDPDNRIYCDGMIPCEQRCVWGCSATGWGTNSDGWPDMQLMLATVQSGCDPLYKPSVKAAALERWSLVAPGVIPVTPVVCAPGASGATPTCEVPHADPTTGKPQIGQPTCHWLCDGRTMALHPLFMSSFPASWWISYKLPDEALPQAGGITHHYTEVLTYCSSDVGYDIASYWAGKIAEDMWRIFLAQWPDSSEKRWAEVDESKTHCTEVEGDVP